jgi:hypothetical protein
MTGITVHPYQPGSAPAWNTLNRAAINGHFLFDRGFMDYHADRFHDASLTVEIDGSLVGIIPATRHGNAIVSHAGLTFGGLVAGHHPTPTILRMLDACADAWARPEAHTGATTLTYKLLPSIYHRSPASADAYWLFRRDARLTRRDITTTIDYRAPAPMGSRRRRGIKRAAKEGVTVQASPRWANFWTVLSATLASRHSVAPVHTIDEITLLADRFPAAIQLHTAECDGEILAGVVMFVTPEVAHAQYIAASDRGREFGALDATFDHLIRLFAATHRYFDFGISTEEAGRVLNEGLIGQQEEFGGGPVCHDIYELVL